MRALSCRNGDPEHAARPFDKARDGFVLGEGAGMLVLESAEHATRRGADVLAIAAGVGYSADAYHPIKGTEDGSGPAQAIQRALADAGVAPDEVVHINAHATSTPVGDAAEAMAITRAMGAWYRPGSMPEESAPTKTVRPANWTYRRLPQQRSRRSPRSA